MKINNTTIVLLRSLDYENLVIQHETFNYINTIVLKNPLKIMFVINRLSAIKPRISVYTSINDTSEVLLIYRFIGGHMISTCTLFFMVSMTQHFKFVLSHYMNVLLIL